MLVGLLGLAGKTEVIVTSLVVLPQYPLAIVHLKVAVAPITKPVTVEVADVGVVIVAVPETKVHVPVPYVGEFPANVVDVTQAAKVWLEPALATVFDGQVKVIFI